MPGYGGAIKLTGADEYKKALSQITQNLKEVGSEMKKVSAEFDKNDKSVEGNKAKIEVLTKKLDEQKLKLSTLQSQYKSMSTSYDENTKKHDELVKSYEKEKTKLEEIKAKSGETSDAYKKQEQKVLDMAQAVGKSTKAQESNAKAMSDMRIQMNNAESDITKTSKEIDKLEKEIKDTEDPLDKLKKGFKDSGEQASKSTSGFSTFKVVLANLTTQVINKAVDLLKKLGSALIEVGKQAVMSYAEFEQLEGGVKKLFGDDMAKEVINNANQAFKTAGMSANDYLDTVTSFSASLISSLGGDTKKAASVADMAIQDMSDNANTFGTDMTSIQNAYQGFAKNNYTMLDNLKLGFSGSKEGMQELLNKAEELTGKKFDISNFSDIAEAIHVVQENMNIAGTTARESSSTIEGSMNSVKAAWSNLLSGLANEEVDPDVLVDNLTGSIETAADNLYPVIKRTIKGMVQVAERLLNEIMGEDAFSFDADAVVEGIENAIKSLIKTLQWLIENKDKVVLAIKIITAAFVIGKVLSFVNTVGKFIQLMGSIPLIASLATKALGLVKLAFGAISGPVGIVIGVVAALTAGVIYLWNNCEWFRNAVITAWEKIKTTTEIVFGAIETFFTETIPTAFNNVKTFFENLPQTLETVWNNILTGVTTFFTETLPTAIGGAFETILETLSTWGENIGTFFTETIPTWWSGIVTWFEELPFKIGYALGTVIGTIIQWGIDVITWIVENVPIWIENISTFFSELPGKIWTWLQSVFEKIGEWGNNVITWIAENVPIWIDNVVTFFSELPGKIWTWLLGMIEKVKIWGSNVIQYIKENVPIWINNIVTFFSELPGKIWNWLCQAVSKVVSWGGDMAAKGLEAAQRTFDTIVDKIKEIPGKMLDIGKDIVTGIWNGISGSINWIKEKVANFAKGILDGMKNALGIHSPSKKFADIIGVNSAKGIGIGFTNEMKNVTKTMNDAIPTDFDVDTTINSNMRRNEYSSQQNLINAFKYALQDMNIVLDDREVGAFVENTIERAVFR